MRCAWFGVLFLMASVTSAWAQLPPDTIPTSATVLVLPPTGDPVTTPAIANGTLTTPIAAGSALCNQAALPVPTGSVTNPTIFEVDDPFIGGRKCRLPVPTGLANSGAAGYRGVVFFTAPTCTLSGVVTAPCPGPRSAIGLPSPFFVSGPLAPPVTPTGLGIRP